MLLTRIGSYAAQGVNSQRGSYVIRIYYRKEMAATENSLRIVRVLYQVAKQILTALVE
ncbi:hypothetical protein [Porphyromonas loveana]|uniref:Uncharacterized protein n=1 Tax=Porphyromonas loveana TaxID=1884669 RepID=A0A2U1FKP2_9PORP|nr:hypothetical protein [Porphyromonas loveana]PVZ12754.1 hypothetical protein C7382_10461 [Porphyromonas loveana]